MHSHLKITDRADQSGYTLIEMIVVVVVIGILAAVSIRSLGNINENARFDETTEKMHRLAAAIAGNPRSIGGEGRENYGYVGDNGCLPSSLDELFHDSHGYATWDGPYALDEIGESSTLQYSKEDAWGRAFTYNGLEITSIGSGSPITRSIASSVDGILYNKAAFAVVDLNFTPPGPIYKDSVELNLQFPRNGILLNTAKHTDAGGYVEFDSVPIGIHRLDLIWLPQNDTLRRRIAIEPSEIYYADLQYPMEVWSGTSGTADTLVQADFNVGTDGFAYADDIYRSTSEPSYASGSRQSSGGYAGGALQVRLGGIDNSDIYGMSGGWSIDFSLAAATELVLSFRYNLSQTNQYESAEYSETLAAIDGALIGSGPNDYIDRIYGDGSGGGAETTGWTLFSLNIGTVSAGSHTLSIGSYNNRKTHVNESTELLVDDVLLAKP